MYLPVGQGCRQANMLVCSDQADYFLHSQVSAQSKQFCDEELTQPWLSAGVNVIPVGDTAVLYPLINIEV